MAGLSHEDYMGNRSAAALDSLDTFSTFPRAGSARLRFHWSCRTPHPPPTSCHHTDPTTQPRTAPHPARRSRCHRSDGRGGGCAPPPEHDHQAT